MPSEQQAESAVHIPSDDARPAFGSCRQQLPHPAALFARDPSPGSPADKARPWSLTTTIFTRSAYRRRFHGQNSS